MTPGVRSVLSSVLLSVASGSKYGTLPAALVQVQQDFRPPWLPCEVVKSDFALTFPENTKKKTKKTKPELT